MHLVFHIAFPFCWALLRSTNLQNLAHWVVGLHCILHQSPTKTFEGRLYKTTKYKTTQLSFGIVAIKLTKLTHHIFACSPVAGQYACLNITVDAAMRPTAGLCYIAMFNEVVMNIINMVLHIKVIAYLVFAISALPYAAFAFDYSTGVYAFCFG